MLLPACDAVIEHGPAAMNVAVVPLTVHVVCVVDAKLTVSPELAVATSVNGFPTVCAPGLAKVIVCDCSATAEYPRAPRSMLDWEYGLETVDRKSEYSIGIVVAFAGYAESPGCPFPTIVGSLIAMCTSSLARLAKLGLESLLPFTPVVAQIGLFQF